MDPTVEGPARLPDNCKEIRSLHEILEEIEESLQDLSETHEARAPAAAQPQLCVPPTLGTSALSSQLESVQTQVMTPWRPTMMISEGSNIPGTVLDQNSTTFPVKALDMLPGDLSDTFSMDHKVTSFDQRKPTATSWITDINDNSKTSFTDCQKTTVTENSMTISNEGSQMKTLSDEWNLEGGQMTFSGNQAHYGGQTTFSGNQAHYGGQMTFSSNQAHYGGQMTAFKGGYTMTFISDQTFTGGQMTTHSGDQALYGSQVVTLKRDQKTPFTDDRILYGSHLMPCQSSSLQHSGFLYFSSSHYTQGQALEKQKSKLKTQRCQFPKNLDILKPYICTYQDCGKSYSKRSHLQIHKRKHTGEKPYKCNVKGCTWEFTRSDELSRHNRKHSGERPYLCTVCNKNFARSDHLKQHQRVHRL